MTKQVKQYLQEARPRTSRDFNKDDILETTKEYDPKRYVPQQQASLKIYQDPRLVIIKGTKIKIISDDGNNLKFNRLKYHQDADEYSVEKTIFNVSKNIFLVNANPFEIDQDTNPIKFVGEIQAEPESQKLSNIQLRSGTILDLIKDYDITIDDEVKTLFGLKETDTPVIKLKKGDSVYIDSNTEKFVYFYKVIKSFTKNKIDFRLPIVVQKQDFLKNANKFVLNNKIDPDKISKENFAQKKTILQKLGLTPKNIAHGILKGTGLEKLFDHYSFREYLEIQMLEEAFDKTNYLEQQKKPAELFISRMQPVHRGHTAIIDSMKNPVVALVKGAKTSQDKEKNPLDVEYQEELLHKVFPKLKVEIVPTGYIPDIVNTFREQGLEVKKIYAGADRFAGYKGQIDSYNKKVDENQKIDVEYEETPRITSATKVREAIRSNNEAEFQSNMPKALWPEFSKLKSILGSLTEDVATTGNMVTQDKPIGVIQKRKNPNDPSKDIDELPEEDKKPGVGVNKNASTPVNQQVKQTKKVNF